MRNGGTPCMYGRAPLACQCRWGHGGGSTGAPQSPKQWRARHPQELCAHKTTHNTQYHVVYHAMWQLLMGLSWITVTLSDNYFTTSTATCPTECICLSQSQVLCNTGGLIEIPLRSLPPTVEHLSLTRNHFHVIRSDAFNGLKSLRKISLDGNNITSIKPFAFRGLPRLKELSIQHTPLATVNQFAFAGLQNLSTISLGYNKIVQIEGYAFAGTNYLKAIQLNNNPLQKIMTNAFSGLTNVEHIVLPSGIKSIEPDSFSGLDTVGVIRLAFMDLPSLRPYTFRGMAHVHTLALQESDLGIIRTAAFDGLAYVENLNIYNNKIDAIQELNIGYNNSIRVLRLHGNHLLEVPAPGVVSIEGVDVLSVKGNHFPCDCRVHTLIEGPLGNASNGDFMATNYCISPMEVNGLPLVEVNIDEIGRCHEHVTKGNLDSSKNSVLNSAPVNLKTLLLIFTVLFSMMFDTL